MRRLIFILLAMIGVSRAQTIQYIGAPTTTVISRGNFRTDSIFYLPKRSKAPTDTAAFRYQISDSSLYVWTGSQWIKAGGIDTTTISTRAWRQKGLDSLAALEVSGSGTINRVPKFTASGAIGNSQIFDNGNIVGINTTTDAGFKLDVNGTLRSVNGANFATTSGSVGVGITNVTGGTKFEVAGNISIKSGADAFLQTTDANNIIFRADQQGGTAGKGVYTQYWNGSGWQNAWYINNVASNFSNLILQPDGGEVYIRRTSDAGSYALQVTGNTYVTGNGIFAATGGNIGIGLENPTERLSILSGAGVVAGISLRGNNNATTGEFFIGHWSDNTGYLINRSNMPIVLATNNTQRGRISETGEWLINIDGADSGDYKLQVTGNILTTGSLTTGTPTGGTKKPWKLGEVATVSPTSPNRTIRVEIDGVVYYIHAKTTND